MDGGFAAIHPPQPLPRSRHRERSVAICPHIFTPSSIALVYVPHTLSLLNVLIPNFDCIIPLLACMSLGRGGVGVGVKLTIIASTGLDGM
jgi:hypothetical protein